MKFVSIIMFLVSMLFAVSALADEGIQPPSNTQDLDSAIIASFDEVNLSAARVMLQASAQLATERILVKEKLDADPGNEKLRKQYRVALLNEKKSIQLTKEFILSLEK